MPCKLGYLLSGAFDVKVYTCVLFDSGYFLGMVKSKHVCHTLRFCCLPSLLKIQAFCSTAKALQGVFELFIFAAARLLSVLADLMNCLFARGVSYMACKGRNKQGNGDPFAA